MQIYKFLYEELSKTKQEVSSFALSAPKKYKIYSIPKRTSGRRTIAHPAKELKEYQRGLIKTLEKSLPVHSTAFAYKKNTSIKKNAKQHQKSKYLLKMDFQNFFHSINPELFFGIINRLGIELSQSDKYLLTQLLFWCPSKRTGGKLVLSVGAPSSPLISNFIMYFFDQAINEHCGSTGITYTRYADDITFSSNKKNILFDTPALVKATLFKEFDGCISINESKTVFSSKAHNRHVTGITITNEGTLSIGRERKRYISSLVHKFSLGQLPDEDVKYLQGLLAFAKDIEPTFELRMMKKYSAETLVEIYQASKVII
jgi:retron-type reverse transcriptase